MAQEEKHDAAKRRQTMKEETGAEGRRDRELGGKKEKVTGGATGKKKKKGKRREGAECRGRISSLGSEY